MRLAVIVAVVVGCGCALRNRGPDGQVRWVEVQTPHFTVRAAAEEQPARVAAARLEQVRAALLAGSWHASVEARGKVEVVLLDDDEVATYLPEGLAGSTVVNSLGHVQVISGVEHDVSEVPVLKHELAHVVNAQYLLRSPLWLNEGLASYLETLTLEGDRATLGRARDAWAVEANRRPLDLDGLFATGPEVYAANEEEKTSFYVRSWLLVHLLANRYRTELENYLGRLSRAEDPRTAWAACCGQLTAAVLGAQSQEYLHGGSYTMTTVPVPLRSLPMTVRALRPAEVLATQAELLAAAALVSPVMKVKGEKLAREARTVDPGEPLAAVATCALAGPDSEACIEAARASARAQPGDPRPFVLLAGALRREHGAEREAAVERAVALAPEEPLALVALADLRLQQRRLPEAEAAAIHALAVAPGQPNTLDALATVRANQGRCRDAVDLEQRGLEVLPEGTAARVLSEVRGRVATLRQACEEVVQAQQPRTPPRKLSCAGPGPRLPKGVSKEVAVTIRFRVPEDGRPAEVTAEPGPPAALAAALVGYVRSCRYAPATLGGTPVPMELEVVFTVER